MGLLDLLDKGQDAIAEKIATALQPRIHTEIDGRVDAFRDSTLQEIPRRCEEGLQSKADSSSVAWLLNKVLGDNTDELVEKIVQRLRPGVTSATDGLSSQATEFIIAKLRDLLDGADSPEEGGQAAVATRGMEQLQVSGEEAPAEEAQEGGGSGGFARGLLGAVGGLVSGALSLESGLPGFEASAKETVHPLFEQLKTTIWELVPATLRGALDELVGDQDDDAVEGDDDDGGGISDWLSSKLSGKAGAVMNKVLAAALDVLDGPTQQLINQLVDTCEQESLTRAFQEVRQKLAEYHLISAETAAAEPSVA